MANYPDPCEKCKRNKNKQCGEYSRCQKWLARYRYRQKQINGYAKLHLNDYEDRRGKIAALKELQNPCENCTKVNDPDNCSDKQCLEWKKWYLARQKLINGYAKKHLPDYEQRKKEGIRYDYEED